MPPYVAIDRPPIRGAKFFESLLCRLRFTLCLEHHTPVRGSKDRRTIDRFTGRAERRRLIFGRGHSDDGTENAHKRQAWIEPAQICFELLLKSITVEANFFGECFFYDSPLLVVENFLIWPPVSAIFRFLC